MNSIPQPLSSSLNIPENAFFASDKNKVDLIRFSAQVEGWKGEMNPEKVRHLIANAFREERLIFINPEYLRSKGLTDRREISLLELPESAYRVISAEEVETFTAMAVNYVLQAIKQLKEKKAEEKEILETHEHNHSGEVEEEIEDLHDKARYAELAHDLTRIGTTHSRINPDEQKVEKMKRGYEAALAKSDKRVSTEQNLIKQEDKRLEDKNVRNNNRREVTKKRKRADFELDETSRTLPPRNHQE